jgi:hypothetical protein
MSVYSTVLEKYAQDLSTETVTPSSQTDSSTMDPSQLQPGQPVYSPEGKEFVVLNNPAGETQKVVMPSDQQGSQLPQGVTTLDDTELSTEYTLSSPSTETKIQSSRKRAAEHMNLPSGYAKSISTGEGKKTETAGLRIGQEGYVDIMTSIQDMVEAGYDTVDVVLNIGELYPRDLGERVLEEARERGIL